jgi:hypothetical protein
MIAGVVIAVRGSSVPIVTQYETLLRPLWEWLGQRVVGGSYQPGGVGGRKGSAGAGVG